MKKIHQLTFLFLTCLLFMSGCQKQQGLVGIWQVGSSVVGTQEIADGKAWFHFREDGTVSTRSAPGVFGDGTYLVNEKGDEVTLISGDKEISYSFLIRNDTLSMNGTLTGGRPLFVTAVPTDSYPVTREDELHLIEE